MLANSKSAKKLSFQSGSPTRYDDSVSSAKLKSCDPLATPFDNTVASNSDSICPFSSQPRIKKQASSDTKTIKISKLLDFHRELEEKHT